MFSGALDRRIRIEQRSVTQDPEYGTEVVQWVEFATVWANVQEVLPSRSESLSEGIRIAQRPARVRMRYMTGVDSSMRLVYLDRDRVMKIVTPPVEMGRKDGLEMMAVDFSTAGDAT